MPQPGSDQPEQSPSPANPATIRFATALVQDGVSGVTVVLPRSPHVLAQARQAAAAAGVSVEVERIGGTSITLRFAAYSASRRAPGNDERGNQDRPSQWPPPDEIEVPDRRGPPPRSVNMNVVAVKFALS